MQFSDEKIEWCCNFINEATGSAFDLDMIHNEFIQDLFRVAGLAYDKFEASK